MAGTRPACRQGKGKCCPHGVLPGERAARIDVDLRSRPGVAGPPAGQDIRRAVQADRRGDQRSWVEPGGILLDGAAETRRGAEDAHCGDVLEGDDPGIDQAGLAGDSPMSTSRPPGSTRSSAALGMPASLVASMTASQASAGRASVVQVP